MEIIRYPKKEDWKKLITRPLLDTKKLANVVEDVLRQVKSKGDTALKEFTAKFDGVNLDQPGVNDVEIKDACSHIDKNLIKAVDVAFSNISKFHKSQLINEQKIETTNGVYCWRKNVAIERVGLYIPGGTAPLFSTVLMLAIPAKLAGCREIVLCSPPGKNGKLHPAIIYAAQKTGIDKIFKAGGAQAIAAMAFGTNSIPQVEKILGPGNQYVTEAKQQVSTLGVSIDMPAGPSEVLVLADETANPVYIAADLLSQAEHGADSQVIFVTYDASLIEPVKDELRKQLDILPRKEIAKKALDNSCGILLKDFSQAMEFSNAYAPEHLIIMVRDLKAAESGVKNAGSVFLGNYAPEAAGDYASGTNHVLPTNGYARNYSGVSIDSFIKKITFQEISKKGLQLLGPSIEVLAESEELIAHKRAVSLRTREEGK